MVAYGFILVLFMKRLSFTTNPNRYGFPRLIKAQMNSFQITRLEMSLYSTHPCFTEALLTSPEDPKEISPILPSEYQ